ncbi:DNA polymerase III subunit beta [Desulfoferrobacter suflitae]|uniref:DNA polymerase III subunit beta n=1 Tax=Desulfoferrobacter suflitae TaxID=2865782 RepID=UPI0021641DA4|nr:DNA polymerase III subunit beta [Desulfoferrobacter suflitae]MCK8600948.1 DNA polymerase III subunit beta [Desulfoferrobacter suflitae]
MKIYKRNNQVDQHPNDLKSVAWSQQIELTDQERIMMKISVQTPSLVSALQKVQNITEKKSNMPILANLLLKATDQQVVEISATDLELSFWTQFTAQIQEPGSISVAARKLLEITRELPQEQILLELLPNQRLMVLAGRSRFELATIPWEDYPHMNFYQEIEYLKCDAKVLKSALDKTSYGIPAEEDPFSVAGLLWHPTESERLRFVSSDGHRLSYVEIPGEQFNKLQLGKGVIIPRKGVHEILRILEKEKEASLGIFENCLMLKTEDSLLSIQLLEAEFPEYQMIIPEERPFAFQVNWENLHSALKRMAVLTDQKWRHVRFIIREGSLELEAGSQDIGVANDLLDIDYQGGDFTVAFNIRYVLDTVQAMESSQVRFEWVDQFHGGVFLAPDDPAYFSLIMPMVV